MAMGFNNNMFGNQRTLRPGGNQPLMQMQGMVNRLQPNRDFMNNMNARMTQTLNRPLDRMRNDAAGVSNAINPSMLNPANPNSYVPSGQVSGGLMPRQNTQMARNVMMGQSPYADTSIRPLNIPGMTLQGNRMVPNRMLPQPSQANVPQRGLGGMTPDQFRSFQSKGGLAAAQKEGYGPENAGYDILARQANAKSPLETEVGKDYSGPYTPRADWAARSQMQSLRRAYTARGGQGGAGFRQFVNSYNQRNAPQASPFSLGAGAITGGMFGGTGNFGGGSQPMQNQAVAVPPGILNQEFKGKRAIENAKQKYNYTMR